MFGLTRNILATALTITGWLSAAEAQAEPLLLGLLVAERHEALEGLGSDLDDGVGGLRCKWTHAAKDTVTV